MSGRQKDPRAEVTSTAMAVWGAAVLVYIVAITGRTSLGVAGVQATEHFSIDASRLAVFTAVQVGVYALAQIPTGVLIDRFGPRRLLVVGALIMAVGQIVLGRTSTYAVAIVARGLIGAGDATAFLSVMRILPNWFPLRKTPVFTQLTASLGQLGQFISAIPFMALLHARGWVFSFVSLGIAGAIIAVAAAIVVLDSPSPRQLRAAPEGLGTMAAVRKVVRHPVCWQAFFNHWTALMPQLVFTLLWGVPLMTQGMGVSAPKAGVVLALNTVILMVVSPFHGVLSARTGHNRVLAALALSAVVALAWLVFFLPSTPRSFGAIAVVNAVLAALNPVSNFGFDHVREAIDRRILATATGMANMGGFIAGMLAFQGVGYLLDRSAAASGMGQVYGWSDFRTAWLAVAVVWVLGAAGLVYATVVARRTGVAPGSRRRRR